MGSRPEEVEADLSELLEEVNSIGKQPPMKAGAHFHARFENIHLFAGGDGRVGRALLNYWLMINDDPPAIIYGEACLASQHVGIGGCGEMLNRL